jgi:hypothetical protein
MSPLQKQARLKRDELFSLDFPVGYLTSGEEVVKYLL